VKRVWVADLVLAVFLPFLALPALNAVVSSFKPPDPYENPYFVWVELTAFHAPLVGSFLVAAAWSYWRPSQALLAQLVPAAGFALVAGVVLHFVATLPDS
jgi:hypothetical protein